jgi:hypothetical protein
MPDHPLSREASGVADTIKAPVKGMTWVPGGVFAMGSDVFYPEERPLRSICPAPSGAPPRDRGAPPRGASATP